MSEIEHGLMCPIHGPGHLGKPCPNESGAEEIDIIDNDYESFEELFAVENLREHFAEVKEQLSELAGRISEFEEARLQHETDPDADQYLDKARDDVEKTLKNFTINGNKIDLSKISNQDSFKGIYNDFVYNVNDYIDHYMAGTGQRLLPEIG